MIGGRGKVIFIADQIYPTSDSEDVWRLETTRTDGTDDPRRAVWIDKGEGKPCPVVGDQISWTDALFGGHVRWPKADGTVVSVPQRGYSFDPYPPLRSEEQV